jgi:segregation and condensation protein B
MSLKAKLEAVIYAAEEPITLAQLATLFAEEALQWKAEQEAAAAQAAAQSPEAASAPLLAGDLISLEPEEEAATEPAPSEPGEAVVEDESPLAEGAEAETAAVPDSNSEPAAAPETAVETAAESGQPAEISPVEEAKRKARERDREVRVILRGLLDELTADCATDGRGVEIREIAGGYRMATKPECHDAVRLFVKSLKPPLKLSLPALETLAVIAYKQPITAPEVNEIRGVDSSGVFGSLLARKLIATAGRKQVIGRPILYKTTREFLLRFGLKDVSELPSMEEFEKMAAIELEEAGPATEEAAESATGPDAAPELDESASEEPQEASQGEAASETDVASASEPTPDAETESKTPEAEPAAPPTAD